LKYEDSVRGYGGMLCEDACGNPENLVRITRDFRADPQECGGVQFSKTENPRKSPRPIPLYFTIYGNLPAYIEKENSSNEDYFSIDIIL
jgi:hypothetical protein